MDVAQVAVFLENRAGGLADVVDVLARSDIDIKALSLGDMADFGILRLIVPDAERARTLLKNAGYTADTNRVVAVEVPDRPGGLAEALGALRRHRINVEYMYAAARSRGERAVIIFRVDEIGRAVEALREANIGVLDRVSDM